MEGKLGFNIALETKKINFVLDNIFEEDDKKRGLTATSIKIPILFDWKSQSCE